MVLLPRDLHTQMLLRTAEAIRRSRELLAETEPLVRRYARAARSHEQSPNGSAGSETSASFPRTQHASRTT